MSSTPVAPQSRFPARAGSEPSARTLGNCRVNRVRALDPLDDAPYHLRMKPSAVLVFVAFLVPCLWAGSSGKQNKAPSAGIDPTEIIGRFGLNYSYVEKKSGLERQSVGVVFEKDLSETSKVGIRVPFTMADAPDGSSTEGMGDTTILAGHRFYHTEGFSALASVFVSLDTASEEQLGEGENSVGAGVSGAWRRDAWLLALSGNGRVSGDEEDNSLGVSPLIGYQPMAKYLSYITLGPSFSYRIESGDHITTATVFGGKILANGDVIALGIRATVDGPDDNDLIVLASFKRLF